MNRRIFSLYKKEILDVLRDKKTLVVMILVPLFLYPSMMLIMTFLMTQINQDNLERTYDVGIVSCEKEEELKEILLDEEDAFDYSFRCSVYDTKEACNEALLNEEIHAYIDIVEEEGTPVYEVHYYMSRNASVTAGNYIDEILVKYKENLRNDLISKEIEDYENVINPIWIRLTNVASNETSMGSVIGMIIPMILITSILMGAIYPAIDVTAGERERGTLETLMTVPVRVSEMMTGKFLAVATIAVFSAVLNLTSMLLVGIYMFDSIQLMADSQMSMNLVDFVPSVLVLVVCLPVFALFTSAICLCICIFAKSFKEANNYSTPILLVFMFASMAGMLPDLELTFQTALIPVVNVSLLIKSLFVLQFDWSAIGIVFLSNIVYSLLTIWLMSKLFSSESVLFGEGFASVHFFENRRNMKKGQMPGIGDNILMFGIMLLVLIYLSTTLVFRLGIWGTGICQGLILLVPLVYAWYMKADFKKLFSLHIPKIRHILGGIFLWGGVFCLEQVVLVLLSNVFPSLTETSASLNASILDAGFLPALLVVGITPAIAEEFAFRGFLFGTIKEKNKISVAIIISAIVFGVYHMNLLQFFGGLMMGIALAYACHRSGSIWVGAMMHFINNGLGVVLQYYPKIIQSVPVISKERYGLSDYLILIAVGAAAVAIGILFMNCGKKIIEKQSETA